jgi:hypothetical protein
MRYFLSLARTMARLSQRVILATRAAGLILTLRPRTRFDARQRRTTLGTITLAAITATTDQHLAVTTATVE